MLKKKLRTLLLLFLLMVSLSGCGAKAGKEKAKALLEEKYGESFTVTDYQAPDLGRAYYTVTAYADKWPDLPFEAFPDEDGGRIADGYVCRRVCEKISETVTENLSDLIPCEIFVHTAMMGSDSVCADPDVSIEEFSTVWEPDNRYYVYLHVDNKNWDGSDVSGYLIYALSGLSGIKGNMTVYFSDQETIGAAEEYVRTHTGIYDSYFAEIERKRKTKSAQYGFGEGRVLNAY